jgi:predicted ester cyclase
VWQRQFAGFPDGKVTVHAMVAEGNTLAAEYTFTGTNTGPLTLPTGQTLPATKKKVSLRGVYVVTLEGDKVKSDHSYWDLAEGLAQLGLMPTPATATA